MAIRIVRLGSERTAGEGLRLGTVRRPPRGVPKSEFASRGFYDVWLPEVAPSEGLVKAAQRGGDDPAAWRSFVRRYRAEMGRPEARHLLDLLAALSHATELSVGCYCVGERRCHRSVLKDLLVERGAKVHPARPSDASSAAPRSSRGLREILRFEGAMRWDGDLDSLRKREPRRR